MKDITLKSRILGAYSLEGTGNMSRTEKRFQATAGMSGYLPILKLIKFNQQEEVRLTNGRQTTQDIATYNKNRGNQNLSQEVIETKKIDITENDIICSPVSVAFNFTSSDISMSLPNGFRKTFNPLSSNNFREHTGNLIILTVYYFNIPSYIKEKTQQGNYFKELAKETVNDKASHSEIMRDIYHYLANNTQLYDEDSFIKEDSCVRVVTITELNEADLTDGDCFDLNTGNTYSKETLLGMDANPLRDDELHHRKSVFDHLEPSQVCVFINDYEDTLPPQYINIGGEVIQVTKTRNKYNFQGLILMTKEEGKKPVQIQVPLEDLSNNKYVYSSRAEANTGANLKEARSVEIEQLKHKFDMERREKEAMYREKEALHREKMQEIEVINKGLEATLLKEREEHKIKVSREQAMFDQTNKEKQLALEAERDALVTKQKEFDLEVSKTKAALAIEQEELKTKAAVETIAAKKSYEEYMYEANRYSTASKNHYETGKYHRDSTLETIKTVGSIVAAGAGIVFLYSKFAK